MFFAENIPYITVAIQFCFVGILFIYFFTNLDDLIIDLMFFARAFYRRFFIFKKYKPFSIEQLQQIPEKPIALMFPAWQESSVIYHCLQNLIQTLDYSNFHIFIGTYPNDKKTSEEVDKLIDEFDNIHQVVTPHNGPTCKADCLNFIIKDIFKYEQETGTDFAAVVMQDAEDIVHPLSLKLFNYLMPRFDLVQIPVISLERKWYDLTGGHYMDEFAEFHSKEILVREMFAKIVPGAGVGTAYSKQAIELAKTLNDGDAFNTSTLTEDYEFSLRLREAGLKQIFARIPYTRTVIKKSWLTGREKLQTITDIICTREFFPNKFWASVRQKTRWTVGISLQGWYNFGWKGNWRIKYLFMRDRKMIILSHAMPIGILVVIAYSALLTYSLTNPDGYQPAPMLAPDSKIWIIVKINFALVIYRLLTKFYWVNKYYSFRALPMVIPRYLWSIPINYIAVVRAIIIFTKFLITGKKIGWDKTSHEYPDDKALALYKRRMGDLLIEKGFINQNQLALALEKQKTEGGNIGSILVEMGFAKERQILEIASLQTRLEIRDVNPYDVPANLINKISPHLAKTLQIFPVGISSKGNLLLATIKIPYPEDIKTIENEVGQKVEFCLALSNDIVFAIKQMYCEKNEKRDINQKEDNNIKMGKLLIEKKIITPEILDLGLQEQRNRYKPLGKILVEQKLLTPKQLDAAIKAASHKNMPLGEYLVTINYITKQNLDDALLESKQSYLCIVRTLSLLGFISEEEAERECCLKCY